MVLVCTASRRDSWSSLRVFFEDLERPFTFDSSGLQCSEAIPDGFAALVCIVFFGGCFCVWNLGNWTAVVKRSNTVFGSKQLDPSSVASIFFYLQELKMKTSEYCFLRFLTG